MPLRKSFGDGAEEVGLSKDQIMDGLFRLMQKSNPQTGFMAPCGESIEKGVALYEQTGQISRSLFEDVKSELGNSAGLVG